MLRHMKKWTANTGNADVPIDFEYKGVHLGQWVDAMRYRYDHGTLHSRRVARSKPYQAGNGAPTAEDNRGDPWRAEPRGRGHRRRNAPSAPRADHRDVRPAGGRQSMSERPQRAGSR